MQRYSISKTRKKYIVQVEGKDVLVCKSRREAEQMVSDASELLEQSDSENESRKIHGSDIGPRD
jgi:hypothetical protein